MKPARLTHPGEQRKIELESAVHDTVEELVAEANQAGFGTDETINALDRVVDDEKRAYEEDPDPAEDPAAPPPN